MEKNQGSITVYLCLTLTILLSLFSVMLESSKTATGRVLIISAMDQGLFSLFAQYDRQLLDHYDLFYINAGYGNTSLQMNRIYDTVRRDALYSLNPYGHGNSIYGNFLGTDLTSGSITGYTLASDQAGNSFERQVSEYMKQKLGVSGIQQLSKTLTQQTNQITSQDYRKTQISSQDPVAVYEQEIQEKEMNHTSESQFQDPILPSSTMVNPIEVIQNIRKMGILSLAVPESSNLSDSQIDLSSLPSKRNLQQGMGLLSETPSDNMAKLMMLEYIIEKFPCYTSEKHSEILNYQIEYVIGQKATDIENLKATVNQLLAIRETSNLIYLYSSPSKKAQADALATTLAASLLLPAAQPVISLALLACWAFAESILDIRELLSGGKVPPLKDDNSWILSLEHLSDFLNHLDDNKKHTKNGFDYKWYLRFLLFTKTQTKLTASAMNLIEYNMNQLYPDKIFRIDNCIDQLEFESIWSLAGQSYTVRRNYQYLE